MQKNMSTSIYEHPETMTQERPKFSDKLGLLGSISIWAGMASVTLISPLLTSSLIESGWDNSVSVRICVCACAPSLLKLVKKSLKCV